MDNTATFDDLNLEDSSMAGLAITVGAAIGGIVIGYFSKWLLSRNAIADAIKQTEAMLKTEFKKEIIEFAKQNNLEYQPRNTVATPKTVVA